MKHVLRIATAAVALCLTGAIPSARGQAPSAQLPCADSAGVGLYGHCALWLDGNVVRRGAAGEIVARPGFFRPMRLARLVSGDSARIYAARYETNTRRSIVLGAASTLLFVAAYVIADSYDCARRIFGICSRSDDADAVSVAALAIGSGLALIASVPFSIRARRAGARAIWWHNARFAG
jgi:hypothetical protein